ncbi:MAG: exopolysaccharide Pel transporter PelG [Planctomycetota bacterium]
MAGIGFDLRRLVSEDGSMLGRLRAYVAAGMISAGPWVVTMMTLLLVRYVAGWMPDQMVEGFLSIVGWTFAASLISVGGVQMAATRYLADALYSGDYRALLPSFATCMIVVAAIQTMTGLGLCLWLGFEPRLTLAVLLLYVAISLSWLAMAWLTVIRQHDKVLFVYLCGALVFLVLLRMTDANAQLSDLILAYAMGNLVVVALMSLMILRGVEAPGPRSGEVLRGIWRHRVLFFVGTAYGLSLWSDKWVFWLLEGLATGEGLRHHPLYDTCFYMGYLTVVPAMSINLVDFETSFYERYRAYFAAVTGNRPLREIRAHGIEMQVTLRQAGLRLLRLQGAITVLCLMLAEPLVELVGLPPFAARVFRFVCLGAFCHVLLLISMLVLLYFDRRHAALRVVFTFLLGNTLLAWWSQRVGPQTYGLGFAIAAWIALFCALIEVRATFARLEYLTFMRR